jgi:hypothetical protein
MTIAIVLFSFVCSLELRANRDGHKKRHGAKHAPGFDKDGISCGFWGVAAAACANRGYKCAKEGAKLMHRNCRQSKHVAKLVQEAKKEAKKADIKVQEAKAEVKAEVGKKSFLMTSEAGKKEAKKGAAKAISKLSDTLKHCKPHKRIDHFRRELKKAEKLARKDAKLAKGLNQDISKLSVPKDTAEKKADAVKAEVKAEEVKDAAKALEKKADKTDDPVVAKEAERKAKEARKQERRAEEKKREAKKRDHHPCAAEMRRGQSLAWKVEEAKDRKKDKKFEKKEEGKKAY